MNVTRIHSPALPNIQGAVVTISVTDMCAGNADSHATPALTTAVDIPCLRAQ